MTDEVVKKWGSWFQPPTGASHGAVRLPSLTLELRGQGQPSSFSRVPSSTAEAAAQSALLHEYSHLLAFCGTLSGWRFVTSLVLTTNNVRHLVRKFRRPDHPSEVVGLPLVPWLQSKGAFEEVDSRDASLNFHETLLA